jgi:hypothetical protein
MDRLVGGGVGGESKMGGNKSDRVTPGHSV